MNILAEFFIFIDQVKERDHADILEDENMKTRGLAIFQGDLR